MDSARSLLVVATLGVVASFILGVAIFKVRHVGLKVALGLLALLTLIPAALVMTAMFPEWTDARLLAYRTFYENIQPGMTREDVLRLAARLYPEDGPRKKPRVIIDEADHLTFFMHPEQQDEPNCEGIMLDMKEGRIIGKSYSPD